jgi:DNA-binding NarL/FixJ family response regulator
MMVVELSRENKLGEWYLTEKDLELIRQLCLPYKVISQNTGTHIITIRLRAIRIARKLGVENKASIIVKALRLGLITLDELVCREFDG